MSHRNCFPATADIVATPPQHDDDYYYDEEEVSVEIETESDIESIISYDCDKGDSDTEITSYHRVSSATGAVHIALSVDSNSSGEVSADEDEVSSEKSEDEVDTALSVPPVAPVTATVDARISTKIGTLHQADLTRVHSYDDDNEGELMWDPSEALESSPDDESSPIRESLTDPSSKVDDFLARTQAPPSYDYDDHAHSLNILDDDTPNDSKTKLIITTEEALSVLHQTNYNVPEALGQMNLKGQYWSSKKRPLEKWSNYEIECFERGMDNHYKLFGSIKRNEMADTGKTVGDIVQYYYVWKKLPRATEWRRRREARLRREHQRRKEIEEEEAEKSEEDEQVLQSASSMGTGKRRREDEDDEDNYDYATAPLPKKLKQEPPSETEFINIDTADPHPDQTYNVQSFKLNHNYSDIYPFWDNNLYSGSFSHFSNASTNLPQSNIDIDSVTKYSMEQFTFFPPLTSVLPEDESLFLSDSFINFDGTDKKPESYDLFFCN